MLQERLPQATPKIVASFSALSNRIIKDIQDLLEFAINNNVNFWDGLLTFISKAAQSKYKIVSNQNYRIDLDRIGPRYRLQLQSKNSTFATVHIILDIPHSTNMSIPTNSSGDNFNDVIYKFFNSLDISDKCCRFITITVSNSNGVIIFTMEG